MKKRSLFITLFCCIAFYSWSQDRVDSIRNNLFDKNSQQVLVVAHRGDWRYAPENSLAAIENAIRMGVDIVELDVQRTKDGQLILMHDYTLDRTTTGKGKISDWTLDSIKTLKLKNGAAIKTRHAVPTLEEALQLARGRILINLDKAYAFFDEVYVLLEKTGTTRQVIMKGSQPAEVVKQQFGQYLDKIIYMPIINLDHKEAPQRIESFLNLLQPVAFELLYVSDNNPLPRQLAQSLRGKSLIWYNTLWDTMAGGHDDDQSLENSDKGYGYLVHTLNARIIQTDRPQLLIDYLKKNGWRD